MKNSFLAVLLALSTGCASAIVRPYVGDQQAWPTGQGSIVNVKYDMPIFTSLPPVAYDLVGEMRIESPFYYQPEEQHMDALIAKARKFNADALVLVDGQLFFSISYGPRTEEAAHMETAGHTVSLAQVNRFNPQSFTPGVSVLAIRWVKDPPPNLPAKYAKKKPQAAPVKSPAKPATKPAVKPSPAATPKPAVAAPKPTPPPAANVEKPAAPTTNIAPSNPVTPKTDDAR